MKDDLHTAAILNDEVYILAVTSVMDRWESPSQRLFSQGLTEDNMSCSRTYHTIGGILTPDLL